MMNILKPFLWYRHIARGVYFATAVNRRNRSTGEPDTLTAFMFTAMLYCSGHVVVFYHVMLLLFDFYDIHEKLRLIVFFGTHKGPFNALVLLGFALAFFIAWLTCRFRVTYEEITQEFNNKKPSHLFTFFATLTVPLLGIVAGIYVASLEDKRYGLNQNPGIEIQQEVVQAPLVVACNPRN